MTNPYREALKAIGFGGLAVGALCWLFALMSGAGGRNPLGAVVLVSLLALLGSTGLIVGAACTLLWLHAASIAAGQERIIAALVASPAVPPAPKDGPITPLPGSAPGVAGVSNASRPVEAGKLPLTSSVHPSPGSDHADATWDGVAAALAALDGRGFPAGLVSPSDRTVVEQLLRRLGASGVSIPRPLAQQINALDPLLMTVLAQARVEGNNSR